LNAYGLDNWYKEDSKLLKYSFVICNFETTAAIPIESVSNIDFSKLLETVVVKAIKDNNRIYFRRRMLLISFPKKGFEFYSHFNSTCSLDITETSNGIKLKFIAKFPYLGHVFGVFAIFTFCFSVLVQSAFSGNHIAWMDGFSIIQLFAIVFAYTLFREKPCLLRYFTYMTGVIESLCDEDYVQIKDLVLWGQVLTQFSG
jgi:hypothetical protein